MGRVKETSRHIGSTILSGPKPQEKGALATETTRSLELNTLSDIARILSRLGGFEEKTAQVAERMAQAADADWVGLRIPDDYVSGLRLIASAGNASQQSPLPEILAYNPGMSTPYFGPATIGIYSQHVYTSFALYE